MLNDKLSKQCQATIQPFISGRSVIDLGAGNLAITRILKKLGATDILAIDKNTMPVIPGIETKRCYFNDVTESRDTAFLSWPINRFCEGLNEILNRHETVIYIGSNLDGHACGSLQLFKNLTRRNPIAHLCEPDSTVLVYSSEPRVEALYAEEFAAIDIWNGGEVIYYSEAVTYNNENR